MPNVVQDNQFQLVQDLLQRQDDALEQLDQLNEKLESAIKEIIGQREEEFEGNDGLVSQKLVEAEEAISQESKPAKAA